MEKVQEQLKNEMKAVPAHKGENIIEVEGLYKDFRVGNQDVHILKNISLKIKYGDYIIVSGPSGCGKSTLLHILLGLEEPTSGSVHFLGHNLYKGTTEDVRSDFRKKHLGMVYQQSNWIKALTVEENVAFPLLMLGHDKPRSVQKAIEQLTKVQMEKWAKYVPTELSSGQQQRVALARALINDPEIIIADEPTGNLDYESGQYIMTLLGKMNKELNKTIVMVTHDLEYVKFAKSVVRMIDGTVMGVYDDVKKEDLMKQLKFKKVGGIARATTNITAKKDITEATKEVKPKTFIKTKGATIKPVSKKKVVGSKVGVKNGPRTTKTSTN